MFCSVKIIEKILLEEKNNMAKKRNFFETFIGYQFFSKKKENDTDIMKYTDSIKNYKSKNSVAKEGLEKEICILIQDLTAMYKYITEISGFKQAVRSDIQLVRDLWLYTITKCSKLASPISIDTEEVAQNLVNKSGIDLPFLVSQHINNMERNEVYQIYIKSAFGEGLLYPGLFWELLASMHGGAKDGEEDATLSFVKKYIELLKMLGRYFQLYDMNLNYEKETKRYIDDFLDKQKRIGESIDSYPDHSLLNPLIEHEEIDDNQLSEHGNTFESKEEVEDISISPLEKEKSSKKYDINQVIWDNNCVRVTYVGIVKQGNFWGIKLLVENKLDKSLTLNSYNICMDDFVVTTSSMICYELPAHRKIFAEASMMFSDLVDLGIETINDMSDIELTLGCEENFEKIAESSPILIVAKEYMASESNIRKLNKASEKSQIKTSKDVKTRDISDSNKKKSVHIENMNEILWENDFVQIIYKGIYKGSNYWGIKLLLENQTDYKISIGNSNLEIDNQIVDVFPYIVFDLKPHTRIEKHISIGMDIANDLGIYQIEDFDDVELKLFCEKNEKKIAQSPQIVIHPIDYLKEIHNQMIAIMDEIDKGIIWKDFDKEIINSVEFEFVYPNGKHGDVDLYLISQWGEFEQLSSISFRAKLSTENLHMIELMVLFYYTRFSQNALLVNRKNNEEAVTLLGKYNNIMRLNNIYDTAANEKERKDILDNLIMQKAYTLIKNSYKSLKEERSEIYAELIANNGSSSRWKSEQQVYAIIRGEFEDAIYQYTAEWLGRQSLDVYIPSLNVAIEYQGRQHYEPLEIFGGEENFKIQQHRDIKKKQLCAENGVKLIEWKYDLLPSLDNFKKLLKAAQ